MDTRVGPYRLLRKIGRGGMGSVYEGVHETIERRVAIKILDAESARQNDLASRFVNEARAVNRVNDPGLVQMFDHGMLPDGTAYIVMEYLEGETLARRLRRLRRRMPVPELLRLLRQTAETLTATHRKGITHRDRSSPSRAAAGLSVPSTITGKNRPAPHPEGGSAAPRSPWAAAPSHQAGGGGLGLAGGPRTTGPALSSAPPRLAGGRAGAGA